MGESYAIIDYIIARLPSGYVYDDEEELLRAIRRIPGISSNPRPFEAYVNKGDWYGDQSPGGQTLMSFAEQGISDSINSTEDIAELNILTYRAQNHGFTSLASRAISKIEQLSGPTADEQARIDDVLGVLRRQRLPRGRPKDVLRILEEDLEDQLRGDIASAKDSLDIDALEDIRGDASAFSTKSRSRSINSDINQALRDIAAEIEQLNIDVEDETV